MNFGDHAVIKDLSFTVKKGEIFGLLGSNGSGKTTTIRVLLNLYQPTSGTLLINSQKFKPSDRTTVGYLPEERGLYLKETVIDTMTYFGHLKGLKDPKAWSLKYLHRVDLSNVATQPINKLSSGMQLKVQLGISIMNNPKLHIFDEPPKAFDPVNRKLLMDIISQLHNSASTILLITHYMDEVERLCDRALLLKDGVARAYGTISDIKKDFNGKSLDDIFVEIYGANDD